MSCHYMLVCRWYIHFFRNRLEVVYKITRFLEFSFDMKDIRKIEVILRIKITRTPNGLKLS